MSFDPASEIRGAILKELEIGIQGLNATKYLSAAGLVILLYDHLLLFGEERRIVWTARTSWSKTLFLVNRYVVPLCLILATHHLSGLSTVGLSTSFCRIWLAAASFLCCITLAIANVFVVHRVYALWGRSMNILKSLISTFSLIYLAAIIATGFSVIDVWSHVSFSPFVRTCIIDRRPQLYIIAYALPLLFDIFLCGLTCWNAFDRPRSTQTAIVKQLYLDGAVYFGTLLSLRIFNILIVAFAPIAYVQLGVFFLWSMITALINRMLITIGRTVEEDPRVYSSSGRETPFEHLDSSFDLELEELYPRPRALTDANEFMDFSYDAKHVTLHHPRYGRGLSFQLQV